MDITELFVDEQTKLKEALAILDKAGTGVLLVMEGNKLIGIITDGDIRRGLMKGLDLESEIKSIINKNYKYCLTENENKARFIMNNEKLRFIPIVNQEKELEDVLFIDQTVKTNKKLNIPVVINAGGLGTRLYPYTKILPKALIPIDETPIIELIMNGFYEYGVDEFYVIVNYKKDMIRSYFESEKKPYKINFIVEDKPLGTGGGLTLIKGKIAGDFIFTNCDTLITENYINILKKHKQEKNLITMVSAEKKSYIPYGIIQLNENNEFIEIKEKPEYTYLVNTGMYIVNSRVIDEFMKEGESIGFPTVFEKIHTEGCPVGVYKIYEDNWLDMGEPEQLEKMRQKLRSLIG